MTLFAADPDVHVVYPVTAKLGDLSFAPVVKVKGLEDPVPAEWLGAPGLTRNLKVSLFGLPAGYMLLLDLEVPDDNDLDLGYVVLE